MAWPGARTSFARLVCQCLPVFVCTYFVTQPIKVFVSTADLRFGPITTIRRRGQPIKKIPWTAFQLSDADWEKVRLCGDILEVRS